MSELQRQIVNSLYERLALSRDNVEIRSGRGAALRENPAGLAESGG